MDAKTLKEQLSAEDLIYLMSEMGVPYITLTTNDNIICYQTMCHCGDSYKLYFYKDTKSFYCYTSCGAMDIISVVEKINGISLKESIEWICNKLNIINFSKQLEYGFKTNNSDDFDFLNSDFKVKQLEEVKLKVLDQEILSTFYRMYHPFFYNDGISFETMDKYNIRYDILNQRIIIPHYDDLGNLIAVRCRNTNEELINIGLKYMPISYKRELLSAKISDYLFGLNFNKENIKKVKKIIIFESEKSVMQMDSILQDNISVALCSSNLSDWQIHLIEELGVEEVILALDKEYLNYGDKEYFEYYNKIKKSKVDRLKGKFLVSAIFDLTGDLGYKDSPSDRGEKIFIKLLNGRVKF